MFVGTKKTFCGFSMGRNQYWAGRVYDLCVYYMTGTPEGSSAYPLHHGGFWNKKKKTFCGFPGYKPVPPGWFKICVVFITGIPKGSSKVVL